MSTTATAKGGLTPQPLQEEVNYLNVEHTISSWLLTGDHKRIAMLYLISTTFFFFLGSLAAGLVRFELTSPAGVVLESETYNKVFSSHGVIMVFLFLVVAIPAVFGYNIFATKLNRFDGELDGFGSEVIALMAREGRI